MPKRNAKYMEAQREGIARAALQVLLDQGIYETSLRDICKAAGVSMGALYTHFATKEDIIIAACAFDRADLMARSLPETWEDYIAILVGSMPEPWTENVQKRFRLSLQFAAEISVMDRNPEGLSAIYFHHREFLASCLRQLREKAVISLPLGMERTMEIHMQLISGAAYQIAANREISREKVFDALTTTLALTAGLVETKVGSSARLSSQ